MAESWPPQTNNSECSGRHGISFLRSFLHAAVELDRVWCLLAASTAGMRSRSSPLQVPGRSVQLDVKFVPRVARARQRFYQFTAIDEATRFRVLHIYDHDKTKTAIDFLREVQEHFPFAIQKIRTDNGSSFGPQLTWHLSDLRISHRHIRPGCPEVNREVERSHKTDSQEFYQGRHFKHKRDLARKLKRWETESNEDRPHLALHGKTPAERVR